MNPRKWIKHDRSRIELSLADDEGLIGLIDDGTELIYCTPEDVDWRYVIAYCKFNTRDIIAQYVPRAKVGQVYFYIGDPGQIYQTFEENDLWDDTRYANGNYFLTVEKANASTHIKGAKREIRVR
jgi:hypothetical protein